MNAHKPRRTPPRLPKQVPWKIRFQWATDGDWPDWFSVWHIPADKGTSNYLPTVLPATAEQLVRRGYARSSIRFECSKSIETQNEEK